MSEPVRVDLGRIAARRWTPTGPSPEGGPVALLVHGFARNGVDPAGSLDHLAERLTDEMGWEVWAADLTGCGETGGEFSPEAWLADVAEVIEVAGAPAPVWLVGEDLGAAVGLEVAASSPRVAGVATLACPVDMGEWAGSVRRLSGEAGRAGLLTAGAAELGRGLRRIDPVRAAQRLAPRPLLVVHGSDDERVPSLAARLLAERHGAAEMRILTGGTHQLATDPRAVAVVLGWLDRSNRRIAPR